MNNLTYQAFRYFGMAAAIFALLFFLFALWDKFRRKRRQPVRKVEMNGTTDEDVKEDVKKDEDVKEEESFLSKDEAENEMLECGRESPAGSYSP